MTTYTDMIAPPRRNTAAVWMVIVVFGAMILGRQVVAGGSMLRVVVAVAAMVALVVPSLERPRTALMWLFGILPFLGVVRHMFISTSGAAFLDPLLLVTSAAAIAIFISLVLSGEMNWGRTFLSKLIFLLLVVGILHVFNPGQAGILVGLTGIMINLIPIAFFFIGRTVSDAEFTRKVTRLMMVAGGIAAVYGLVQVYIGFRGFELDWLATQGYTAAQVGGTLRPFSVFNNAAEYAAYAHLAFVLTLAWLLFAPRTKRTFLLAVVATIGYSGFLIGSRGFTLKIGLAVIVLLAARARNRILATGVVMLLVGLAVYWSATTTTDSRIEDREVGPSQLIEQQLQALRDPFNRDVSTLPIHFDQASEAIVHTVRSQPLGLGTGAPTRGGAKFGGFSASAELDIGDAFLAWGVIGGGLYIVVIMAAITVASRVRRALPGPVWIGIWAMILTSVGAWQIGGNYSIGPMIWFLIGAADAAYERLRDRGLLRGTLRT